MNEWDLELYEGISGQRPLDSKARKGLRARLVGDGIFQGIFEAYKGNFYIFYLESFTDLKILTPY